MTSKTETPDIVERLRRDLETLRPYIGRPIGGEGSAARREQENKQAAYVEAVEILHDLARLRDPVTVHRNMLHGSIAKPSWANILHLYPEQRDEIERLRSELAKHQWRTMGSFPADGECYLATDARVAGGHSQVVWCDHEVGPSDGLYVKDVSLCYPHGFFTHWMPLPPPPSPQGENDG